MKGNVKGKKKGKPQPQPEPRPLAYGDGKHRGCANAACKLRKKGCSGFAGCPGYK